MLRPLKESEVRVTIYYHKIQLEECRQCFKNRAVFFLKWSMLYLQNKSNKHKQTPNSFVSPKRLDALRFPRKTAMGFWEKNPQIREIHHPKNPMEGFQPV